jgi:hypothetical protein
VFEVIESVNGNWVSPSSFLSSFLINKPAAGRHFHGARSGCSERSDDIHSLPPRFLRIDSPRISMRWALCTSRSRMLSARVGSQICSCHWATGNWLVKIVERLATLGMPLTSGIDMRYALVLATLLVAPAYVCGCSCAGPNPVCSAYWQSPAIFRGRVLEQALIGDTKTTVKNLDGTTSTIVSPGQIRVRFSVLEMLKGEPQPEIVVLTKEQGSACGFQFEDGREYIVFTDGGEGAGELWTTKCSRTHALVPGENDADLAWMRALATAPDGATIFGDVRPPGAVFSGSTMLTVRGPENHEVAPDDKGHYVLSGLVPGQYHVSATAPPGFVTHNAVMVTLPNKGCAEVDWPVYYDGHVRGQVIDRSGHALPGVFMALQRRDSRSATGLAEVDLMETDSGGRYDFARVSPGDYLVAANLLGPSPKRPYPRVYYPDADSDAEAASVHVIASGIADDMDLTFPNAWRQVTVHATVLLRDGSPAAGAAVEAHDTAYLWSGEPAIATAGADGRAALAVYEGRTYFLTAFTSGGTQQACAGPLKFTARDGLVLDPISIDHNWGNCLAQLNPNFRPPR